MNRHAEWTLASMAMLLVASASVWGAQSVPTPAPPVAVSAPIKQAPKIAVPTSDDTNVRYTMYFTGGLLVVAILQAGFFVWQLWLMRTTVRDTHLAAKAAELNARAAVGIELPILRVLLPDLLGTDKPVPADGPYGGWVNDGPPTKFSAVGMLDIHNHGRTPAFPSEIIAGWLVAHVLPPTPLYIHRKQFPHAAVIKPGDDEYDSDLHFGIELTDAQVAATRSGTEWLWVYGCIHYTDFLAEKREYRFCWRFANRNVDSVFYAFASDGDPPKAYICQK
jgi:hypothetical protein